MAIIEDLGGVLPGRTTPKNIHRLKYEPITDSTGSCCFTVTGTLASCKIVRDMVSQVANQMPFTDEERGDLKLAVGEAISNAIKHGCHGSPEKSVNVQCIASPAELIVEITDNGPGFDPDNYLGERAKQTLPESGMGIRFMKLYVDQVSFSFTSGTTTRLVKRVRGSIRS